MEMEFGFVGGWEDGEHHGVGFVETTEMFVMKDDCFFAMRLFDELSVTTILAFQVAYLVLDDFFSNVTFLIFSEMAS